MKKLLGISVMAMLAVSPMMANAASSDAAVKLMTNAGTLTQDAGGTTAQPITANQQIATTSYVAGAYNALAVAHNELDSDVVLLNANDQTEGSVDYKIKTQAAGAEYDNDDSGLTAGTIQGAIDEVEGRVDTLETNTTLDEKDVSGHSTTLVEGASVKANLIKLATAIENAGSDATVANGNYIRANNNVADNLTNLDAATKTNSNAITAILNSTIPVYSTWGSATADASSPTVGSLQATLVPAATNVTADTVHSGN